MSNVLDICIEEKIESVTLAQEKVQIEQFIERFEKEAIGLPSVKNIITTKYLNMGVDDFKKMGIDELNEAILSLANYSLYCNRILARNKTYQRWAKYKLDEIASGILQELDEKLGYNERELIARHNHQLCKILNRFLIKVEAVLDSLYHLPKSIEILVDSINNIKFNKLRKEKNNG